MRRWIVVLLVAAWFSHSGAKVAFPQAVRADAGEEFSFYGLRFGMDVQEVRRVFPTNADGTEALEVKHGMRFLQFVYDYRNRLGEIRASYERPGDGLREAALRLALRERFIQPISSRWRNVTTSLDENSNRAAIILVLVSQTMRQEAIEHFRDEYLSKMD